MTNMALSARAGNGGFCVVGTGSYSRRFGQAGLELVEENKR